jgi:hypothetical protein
VPKTHAPHNQKMQKLRIVFVKIDRHILTLTQAK